ncbi:hypothetical protein VQ02_06945 [Methylobacterium variabile]|uniref:GtrA/DPMS transmembrane domain-containing protein n=1 Tax=Methylobacterium variabile TaxID=298794 RepID=A0A0J6T5R4_9HYPH|nr:hypothetical protein VQ02_06945 [Methylobacterium variabile]
MIVDVAPRQAIDIREFVRFVGTGVTATIGNLAAVWIVARHGSFGLALLAGSIAGFILSFVLSKLVAFRARSWDRAWAEALRFTLVHGAGAVVYWVVGFAVGRYVLPHLLDRPLSELGGAFVGAGVMTATSYFGHRFFTYRTYAPRSRAQPGTTAPVSASPAPSGERSASARHSEDATSAALVGLLAFVGLGLLMPRGVGLFDEGIILSDAMRVAAGEVVHRDFYSSYGPAQYTIVAAVLGLTDGSFLAVRLYDVACKAVVCALLFSILRGLAGGPLALLAIAAAWLWFAALAVFPLYPIYPCMILGLVATWLMVGGSLRPGGLRVCAAAGACAGAAALFRYEVGFFLLVANLLGAGVLIGLDAARGGAARRYAGVVVAYGLGTSLVFLPAAAAYLLVAPVGSFWHDIVEFSTKYYAEMRGLPFPRPWEPKGGVYFAPLIAGLGLVEAGRISWPARRPRRDEAEARARAVLVLFSLCTLLFFLKGIVRVSAIHVLLATIPALVVAAILARRWLGGSRLPQAGAILVLLLTIGPPAVFAASKLRDAFTSPDNVLASLIAERAGLRSAPGEAACRTTSRSTVALYPPDHARAANYVARRTRPDERIFVALDRHDMIFTNPVALYFAVERLPGTHWHQFDPGLQTRADTQAAIVADLQDNRVRWVIRDGSMENPNEPNGSSRSSGVTLLDEFLDASYRPVASSGRVAVWLLKSEAVSSVDHQSPCEATAID